VAKMVRGRKYFTTFTILAIFDTFGIDFQNNIDDSKSGDVANMMKWRKER
jgi:hypothetical protein